MRLRAPQPDSYNSGSISTFVYVRLLAFGHCLHSRGVKKERNMLVFWHLIPGSTIKFASCFLLVATAPLLKEKRHLRFQTLIANISYLFGLDRTRFKA